MTELSWTVRPASPPGVAAMAQLHGDLRLDDRDALTARLGELLVEHHRVVLDVSDLRLHHSQAVHAFTDALFRAGGWPAAGLTLAAPDTVLAAVLTSSRVAHETPMFAEVDQAMAHADDRPPLVRTGWRFGVDPYAPGRARAHVRDVCDRWQVDLEVREAAEIVITELVTNAVEHAGSSSVVGVERRAECFRMTVRDFETRQAVPEAVAWVAPPTSSPRGRGLAMVAAVSSSWGVHRHPDGKTVWAEMEPARTDALDLSDGR